ncbi:MAG: copper resistance protein CopC [Candidatus Rokuibacteriota bacterium]|nr:MAG: copper resistance protein CopC [Candidatus Rokubacteria bacterium]
MASALLLVLSLVPRVAPAVAHAIVLESIPANDAVLDHSPERIMLRFNSKIEKPLTRVTLAAGRATPRPLSIAREGPTGGGPDRIVVPLEPLPAGRYVIRYTVLSADGHVTEGALRFSVGNSR